VLFGLLGALLIAAAFRPPLRTVAAIAGLVSMLTFAWLALPLAEHNAAIQRVFWIDIVASVLLASAWFKSVSR
jgi:hypothetical protein